jgi:hypothetical protein
VKPLDMRASTGAARGYPSTDLQVKPFDVRLSVGGFTMRIRPFRFSFG